MSNELAKIDSEVVQLDYRTMSARADWLKQRMSESGDAGQTYKVIAGLVFLLALVAIIATFASAIPAILGGTAGSAAEYALAASANQFILQLATVILGAVVVPALVFYTIQPTHLLLTKSGLRFAARGVLPLTQSELPWQDVEAIDVVHATGVTGSDRLVIRSNKKRITLRLAALSPDDRARLLSAIKQWAPLAVHDPAVVRALSTSRDQSYTELWLQAFTGAPKRENMLPLNKGALLNQKYSVLDYLGMGGQGTAYLAEESQTKQKVVLKEFILPVYVDANVRRQALKSFENEARILKTLDHRNVVKLLDFFVADQRAYLVLEFVDGPSLKSLVQKAGPLPSARVSELALQLCDALTHLHHQSPPVVHRDVSPDNLILSSDGILKLVDFNVAHQSAGGNLTAVVGKQAYMPPEQFRGEPGPQSDIYAAGATLFYLLTGQEPEAISVSHPMFVLDEVDPGIDAVVAKATAIDLSQRYPSAELMKKDLCQLTAGRA